MEAVVTCLLGDVHCCGVGASSGGASFGIISSRPGFCKSMFMQLKIYVHVTESMEILLVIPSLPNP